MKTSVNRIQAIFVKDFKDLMKNLFISSSMILPIVMAFMYSRMPDITIDLIYLIINLSFVFVAFLIQCSMIAEEKEKNTLRGLMLSPASTAEILTGKSALSFMMTSITLIASFFIMNYVPGNSFIIAISIAISILFYIILGTLFGLLTNSIMEASVISLPVMFVFGLTNLVEGLAEKYNVSFLIDYLPNMQMIEIARLDETGTTFATILPHLLIIIAWLIVTSIVTMIVFKKKEMNE